MTPRPRSDRTPSAFHQRNSPVPDRRTSPAPHQQASVRVAADDCLSVQSALVKPPHG
jgi:hypothetical protein